MGGEPHSLMLAPGSGNTMMFAVSACRCVSCYPPGLCSRSRPSTPDGAIQRPATFPYVSPSLCLPPHANAATRELAGGLADGTLTKERAAELLGQGAVASSYTLVLLAIWRHWTDDTVAIISMLLERGAHLDYQRVGVANPIHAVIELGRYDVANLLLGQVAKGHLRVELTGQSLLETVACHARHGRVSSAEKLAMVKKLVKIGGVGLITETFFRSREGHVVQPLESALTWFCIWPLDDPSDQLELVAFLIHKAGQRIVNRRLPCARAPVYLAACNGCSPAVLRLLFRSGASLSAAAVRPDNCQRGETNRRLLGAYAEYLRDDLPVQLSIAVKTFAALLDISLPAHCYALVGRDLPNEVTQQVALFLADVSLPIGEQPLRNRVSRLLNGYLSRRGYGISQVSYADLQQQVRQAIREEADRFHVSIVWRDEAFRLVTVVRKSGVVMNGMVDRVSSALRFVFASARR